MPTILWLVHPPLSAGMPISTVGQIYEKQLYLAVLQDRTETHSNKLEWGIDIFRVSHPTE